jgi:hypothetical protein
MPNALRSFPVRLRNPFDRCRAAFRTGKFRVSATAVDRAFIFRPFPQRVDHPIAVLHCFIHTTKERRASGHGFHPFAMGPKADTMLGKFSGMKNETHSKIEIRDVATGLWIWRLENPFWEPGVDWEPVTTSTCVQSGGEILVLDPQAPPEGTIELWKRLDAHPPTIVVVLKPDHVRDTDVFVRRYSARAFGPRLFFRDDIPETDLEPIEPGSHLPGGIIALYDGRGRGETSLWLPRQRTLVFADALTAPGGELRVWGTPWHEERVLPALRELLKFPFEQVIVSHGEPVHTRLAYERALTLTPWSG